MSPVAASPWAGLRSRFLDSREAAEQVRIFDLSARTAQTLHRWAARYPLIRRVRVWPVAFSVVAAAYVIMRSARGQQIDMERGLLGGADE